MSHDDFEIEPVPGLPELPPEGETILWQGKPDWWTLARESLAIRGVMIYFIFLGAWRSVALMAERDVLTSLKGAVPFLILGLIVVGLLTLIAVSQALTTVYTVTNRRIAMRIGAALNVTYNLPYTWIESADLDLKRKGTGTIALKLKGDTKLSYLMLWPHVRPWHLREPQPALRCIPDAERVARIVAEAARTQITATRGATARDGQTPSDLAAMPAE